MTVVGLPTHAFQDQERSVTSPPPMASVRTTLGFLVYAYVAGVILLILALAWIDWNQRIAAAERASGRIVSLLAERAQRTITATERILEGVSERAASAGVEQWAHDPLATELFRASAFALPGLGALWVFDEQGRLILGSDDASRPPGGDYQEGEHHLLHRAGFTGTHLAGVNRVDGRMSWPMSRAILGADGTFRGTVLASILVDSFANIYEVADLGTQSTLTLVHDEGHIMMRYPVSENMIGKRVQSDNLRDVPPEGVTRVRIASPIDNTTRLFALRRLEGAPVIAVVGVAIDDIRDAWSDFVGLLLVGAFIGIFPVAFFGTIALRSAAREAAAGAALAESNAVLEDRVRTRTEELQVALRRAQIATAARGRFIAAANRDLRQPLQSVRLFIDLLGIKLAEGPHENTINNARQALDQGEAVLVSLREISRLDAGMIRTIPEDVPMASFLADLAARHREACRSGEIELRLRAGQYVLRTDPVLLATALDELLSNAIKYTERGGVLLALRTYADRTVIEVWDTGCGVHEEDIPAIFEDFVQMKADRTGTAGLGLGLSLARRIVTLLGYTIEVRSRPGHGSVFRVTIPALAERIG